MCLAAIACILPALAFAALPKKDSAFSYCKSGSNCPLKFQTTKSGGKIKDLTMYNDCAQLPPMEGHYPKVRVNDEGKFNKSGKVTDVTGSELTFTIKGRFKKPKKAVGTFEIDSSKSSTPPFKPCDSKPAEFVAKRTGPAQ